MYSDVAIKVEGLSKCYQIYAQPRDRLKQFMLPNLQQMLNLQPKQYYKEFWALKDVSFEVKKGETVGIIGCNGSGKSTLLQMICGTLNPTSGSIQTSDRIAALLELGSGFNPEFSGRENVYINGAVLGLSRDEIDARFDAIAAFADIGQFIEQPVKNYSSGMAVRLAFSVAINVDPEILIVDEALSVGDELFQRKCFSRIESMRTNGVTILFVSHSSGAILELCDRALLMDAGERLAIGSPKQIIGRYQKLLYASPDVREAVRERIRLAGGIDIESVNVAEAVVHEKQEIVPNKYEVQESFDPNLIPLSIIEYESNGAHIEYPMVQTLAGEPVNNLIRGKIYKLVYSVSFTKNVSNVRFGMLIKTTSGVELGGATSATASRGGVAYISAGCVYRVEFKFCCLLNTGIYFLNAGVLGDLNGSETYLHRLLDIFVFRVQADEEDLATGVIDFGCCAEVELMKKL
jgi:lipopolysaccharide transport system ATP-binding protein